MDAWKISGRELSAASGRTPANISNIRRGTVSPSLSDFEELVKICDRLRPGFAADYYSSLSGDGVELSSVIGSLNSEDLRLALILISNRMGQISPPMVRA